MPGTATEGAVRWLAYTVETEMLMNEIEDATTRVSTLVGAAKQYSQMDRAPFQVVDVHELLDSTLVMLARKIGDKVKVVKEYDRSLPPLPAYAAELNQVWTNLIDNAVQAMAGEGTLTIRTYREDDCLVVGIGDTGPGVPPEIAGRIFEPFFTTKPVGEGTGLGLDISWRIVVKKHHGDIRLESEPGATWFLVRLPLTAPAGAPGPGRGRGHRRLSGSAGRARGWVNRSHGTRRQDRATQLTGSTGRGKEAVGAATDDEELRDEGRGQQTEADVKDAGEKVKDAADKVGDAFKR